MRVSPVLLFGLLSACATDDKAPADTDSGVGDDTGAGAGVEACGYTPAADLDAAADVVEVELRAADLAWDPGTGVPLVDGLGFSGSAPGPLLEATRGDTLRIHFYNDTDIPLTLHWHGLRVPEAMDGVTQMMDPVQPGSTFTYEYVLQDAGFYWYHPHMSGDTVLERGLYGGILVHERGEVAPDCDLPLVLDDILLDRDDQIEPPGTPMDQIMGRLGNVLIANGRSGRRIGVTRGQTVLLRLVNAANARYFDLALEGHPLEVVGTDGGWLATPYTVDHLPVAPGERYLVRVQMTGEPGAEYRLMNRRFQLHEQDGHMIEYDPMGDGENPVLSLVYGAGEVADAGWSPPTPDVPSWTTAPATLGHHWLLDEDMMGGSVTIDGASWPDVPMVTVQGGVATTFEVENLSEMHHPFHIHGNRFQVLAIDDVPVTTPAGWKDTWDVAPRAKITVASELDNAGEWIYHCHILEHAEEGMAGLLTVE